MSAWSRIPEWRAYEASDAGEIRRGGRVLRQCTRTDGYWCVHLSCNGKNRVRAVHRLVYAAFHGPIPDRMTVNHIDGDKLNNRLVNLELLTIGQNLQHAARLGLTLKGERNNACKLTDQKVREARELYARGNLTFADLASYFHVTPAAIRLAVRGESWKHVV